MAANGDCNALVSAVQLQNRANAQKIASRSYSFCFCFCFCFLFVLFFVFCFLFCFLFSFFFVFVFCFLFLCDDIILSPPLPTNTPNN